MKIKAKPLRRGNQTVEEMREIGLMSRYNLLCTDSLAAKLDVTTLDNSRHQQMSRPTVADTPRFVVAVSFSSLTSKFT